MRKFNLLIALGFLAGTVAIAPPARAQDEKQAEFERGWYNTCYTLKDIPKCYQQSKELIEKYPNSTYRKNAEKNVLAYEQKEAFDKFSAALKAYYEASDAAKLEALYAAGEGFYKFSPNEPYVAAQLALASTNAVLGAVQYKNLDKAKGYVENGMKVFESATPVGEYKADQWAQFRELMMTQGNQYLGYYLIETKGNPEEALNYLTKAIAVKGKDGAGWKDPNNYLLRSGIYSKQYEELRKQYDQLPDEKKTGDEGKELLKQVNQLLDKKLIPEYARVLATSTKPEYKPLHDQTKPLFDSFWKYRTNAPEKSASFLKAFEADPNVEGPEVPAKAEDSATLDAPAAPVTGGTIKTQVGNSGAAPGASSTGTKAGAKAAPGKKAPAKRRR